MRNITRADAIRNSSIANNRPNELCRWCARPIHATHLEVLRFYCSPACVTSAAWFVASKKDFGSRAYKAASLHLTRSKITLPTIAMEAA